MSNKQRGFATMVDKERLREIASMGGRAVHEKGSAHTWNSTTAREAAKKSAESKRQKALDRIDKKE